MTAQIVVERETDEALPVHIFASGVEITDPARVELSLTTAGVRPSDWQAPLVIGDALHVHVVGLDPGTHHVYARVTSAPETPVVHVGSFYVA